MQNYTYKGWSVLLNGKSPLFSNSYEFHVTINFCKDIVDSIFMPIVQKQNLSKGEEVILMCKISACPNSNLASYKMNIKKKWDIWYLELKIICLHIHLNYLQIAL